MNSVARFPAAERPEATSPWTGDSRLVAAARNGDREAAEELAGKTYTAVYASLYRMCGDGDLAADLTQETYQKAWRALGSFDGRAQFWTWLYRIAYTTFLNHIRYPRRIVPLDEPGRFDPPDPAPAPDETVGRNEEAARIREAVLTLPEDLRFTVTAHYWGGLEVKEIARIERMTSMGIRKRLKKAIGLLQTVLGEEKS